MLGEARQCYRSPPVVLITVHDKGIHWSGRREESRGDPCCSRGVGGETVYVPRCLGRRPDRVNSIFVLGFVKHLRYTIYTFIPVHDSSCHVFKAPHGAVFSCVPPPVTNHLNSTRTSTRSPPSVFSSHQWIICPDHYCFSAWLSSSSTWMSSYQIKKTLSDPHHPLHHPTPGSPHTRPNFFSTPLPLFVF